jgi:osmotically inducible lipoprotein OsmB
MKFIYPLIAVTALISACAPGAAIDSDMERGLVGAALGYGAAKAVKGNGDRGAIIGGLAGVFCDDAGFCSRPRY